MRGSKKNWENIVLAGLAFGLSNAAADEVYDLDLAELLEVKLTAATKTETTQLTSPNFSTHIDRQEIDQYGWADLNEVLALQPGMAVSQSYERRTLSSRGVHEGWSNNHHLLLIDGVAFNELLNGSAFTSEVTPLFLFDSVEFVRGPGSALYGSNAVHGVISLTTPNAESLQGKGTFRVRAGSHGTQIYEALSGSNLGKFSLVLGASSYRTSGNSYSSADDSGRTDANGAPARFQTHDQRSSQYFLAKLQGKEELKDFSLQFHRQSSKGETGHGWLFKIPEFKDQVAYDRTSWVARYTPFLSGWKTDFMSHYQQQAVHFDVRLAPTIGGTDGTTEVAHSRMWNLNLRAQGFRELSGGATLLLGTELSRFTYLGDHEHYSNRDLNSGGTGAVTSGGDYQKLRPLMEWIDGHPIYQASGFAQLVTGDWLGSDDTVTAGIRYDHMQVSFNQIAGVPTAQQPPPKRTFSNLSPRLSYVHLFTPNLSLRSSAGIAFRAPTPGELGEANSSIATSNPAGLRQEVVRTYEMGPDWMISKHLNWRTALFYSQSRDLVDYNSSNQIGNIYDLDTGGAETELTYRMQRWSTFLNASYTRRFNEKISTSGISEADGILTWYPALTANLGVSWTGNRVTAAASAHYQGKVKRRNSDYGTSHDVGGRPAELPAYVQVDSNFRYRIHENFEAGLDINNIFDRRAAVIRNANSTFDYQLQGRTFLLKLETKF